MFYMHGAGWAWWVLMSLGMVALSGLVIFGVLSFIRRDGEGRDEPARAVESPLTVLKRRLAGGEISVDEYEELRTALADEPPVHASV